MRALRFDGTRLHLVSDVPDPVAGPDEALVRIHLAGICRTDLEICRGYLGFRGIPGHEWVGEVVAAPDAALRGARVVGEINFGCGTCDRCRGSLARHCPTRRVQGIVGADGAFAELMVVPATVLHQIPEELPDRVAVFTEPVAAAFEILEQLGDVGGMRALVLGDGKLGLLIAFVLDAHGYRVHHFGRHPEKLALSPGRTSTAAPANAEYEWTVDATGSPEGLRTAVAMTRPRGTLILKSTVHDAVPVDTAPIIVHEITLVGSRCGRFEAALPLLGIVPLERLIAARYPLAEAPAAFAAAASGCLKVLLEAR